MLKEVKKIIDKELKEIKKLISQQVENMNKETAII